MSPDEKLEAMTRDADQPATFSLRPADLSDAPEVADLVTAAYRHYVERIGRSPRPMTEDYVAVIRDRQVTVAESLATIVGVIVLDRTDEGFLIDSGRVSYPITVALLGSSQPGLGLWSFAQRRRAPEWSPGR